MKRLIISFIVLASFFVFSCDTTSDHECNRSAMNELVFISFHCSDATYISKNGYADYNDCINKNMNIVELTIISCKGRDGVYP
jgi:hypothetical protein